MPITQLQREKRKNRIGSSDMAAILGFTPKRNALDVWLEKTGKLEEKDDRLSEHDPLLAGTYFEDGVLQYAEREFGKITRNQFRTPWSPRPANRSRPRRPAYFSSRASVGARPTPTRCRSVS